MAEQLKTLLDFLLFPNNEHFRDMRDSFLSSRFLFVILGAVGAKVGKRLLAPCSAEHDPEEFLKKPWNCLTEVEKDKVKNQPFKYLCLRHKIGAVHWGILHVLIRMVCIHVLPCILVLYWGWLECDGSTEMLRISFMVLYALYLISTVVVFFNKLCTDRLDFARSFCPRISGLQSGLKSPALAGGPGWLRYGSGELSAWRWWWRSLFGCWNLQIQTAISPPWPSLLWQFISSFSLGTAPWRSCQCLQAAAPLFRFGGVPEPSWVGPAS